VTRAGLGGVLTGLDLLRVSESLEVQQRARSGVRSSSVGVPLLAALVEDIPDLDELRRQIVSRIGVRGEVLDGATPGLGAIRAQVRDAYDDVTQALTAMIQSPTGQGTLQDQVISVRSDRFVVQVKTEMRHRVPGIVHGASNTGATLFIEPFSVVDQSNRWRELVLEEEREVRRVLAELSSLVGTLADDILRGNERAASLDLVLARARYGNEIGGVSVAPRRVGGSEAASSDAVYLRLLNARHPLLGSGTVPISVSIGPGWSVLVVTGPNTGGKTVAMKTVGLLSLMHQSGLQIPAEPSSSLPVFDGVYADIGDQQSIERSVSTFSSHMRNVIEILAHVGPSSLVLLDEIGTSTDPEEGSALAKSILGHLAERGVPTIATTHHRTVAAFAASTLRMNNASVQLDPETLNPTYHLTIGVPGRSYAMSVAEHMGLPKEIMENARSLLEPQHLRFEDWLNELQGEREDLQSTLAEAEQSRARAEALRADLEAQIDYLVTHREDILDSTRRDLVSRYEAVLRDLKRAEASLSWTAPSADVRAVSEDVSRIRHEIEVQRQREPAPVRRPADRPLEPGELVHVRGLNMTGTVAAVSESTREAEVTVGKIRLRIDLARLSRAEPPPEDDEPEVRLDLGPSLLTTELDVRGLRAEETLIRLEEFLDKAVRDGLSSIRVIHGRGTGVLRQVVREHVARHPLVKSFEAEVRERGGDGATAIELA
jgi:DNA mismatch repair protein MutS2